MRISAVAKNTVINWDPFVGVLTEDFMTSVLCVNRGYICNSTGCPALHDGTGPGSFPKCGLITQEWEFCILGKQLQPS